VSAQTQLQHLWGVNNVNFFVKPHRYQEKWTKILTALIAVMIFTGSTRSVAATWKHCKKIKTKK